MNETQDTAPSVDHRQQPSTDETVPIEIYREQVTLLFQQFQIAFIAIVLIAPLFVVYLNQETDSTTIIAWLVSFWVLNLLRYYHCHKFFNTPPELINYPKSEQYFLFGTMLSGLLWGSVAFLFFPETNHVHQTFLFFILAGLSGGAISTLSHRPLAFRLFMFPMFIPFIIKLFILGDNANQTMAILLLLFIVMMMIISSRFNRTITESLQLRFEKGKLFDKFKQLEADNSQTNSSLKTEIRQKLFQQSDLEKKEALLSSVLITANDGIITSDSKGIILSVNHAIERDFGYTEQELIGNSINIIMTSEMGPKHDNYITDYVESNRVSMIGRMIEIEGKKKDGTVFPIEVTVSEARINDKIFFTGIIRNITNRKASESHLQHTMQELQLAKQELEFTNAQLIIANSELLDQSQHDELTGLANRRYLMKTMKQEWFRCQRNQKPLSVILLDIDFFKLYNDEYGHQAGDECLIKISQVLRQQLSRSSDFIARYGGEEFIAVIPETDQEGAFFLAEKMCKKVSGLTIQHRGSSISAHVTISGGVASTIPTQECSCEILINLADEALYRAKSCGRNNIQKTS